MLKRKHGLLRCRYHGMEGMNRWVGLGVIANNLIQMGKHLARKPAQAWENSPRGDTEPC